MLEAEEHGGHAPLREEEEECEAPGWLLPRTEVSTRQSDAPEPSGWTLVMCVHSSGIHEGDHPPASGLSDSIRHLSQLPVFVESSRHKASNRKIDQPATINNNKQGEDEDKAIR
jgi:hypothetical protein